MTSLGDGVPQAMIFSASFFLSTEHSMRQTSGRPAPASGSTCSAVLDTSHFRDRRKSFCCSAVDFAIFSTGAGAGVASAGASGGLRTCSAKSMKRSTWLPSADLFRITSSQSVRNRGSMSEYLGKPPGLTIDMLRPLGTAWYKKTLCMQSLNLLRPRKEKERLLRPPLKDTQGHVRLISATALMKSRAYELCSGRPVDMVRTLQSNMISSGLKSSFLRSSS
mmetsp:Transcript_72774/g.206540  ORF Transcript_72774/g.206540 Transcript_72774/m.206540 type:complete len:221 (+) Transcript_72774:1171-1833(+)